MRPMWFLIAAVRLALIWLAFVTEIEGVRNLMAFYIVVGLIVSPFQFAASYMAQRAERPAPAPTWLRSSVRALIWVIITYDGAFVLGTMWAIQALLATVNDEAVDKIRRDPANRKPPTSIEA